MAAEDVELIRRHQPAGPYTLWGYSFGARVAFEAAYQLERAGERVENLFLIAPGQPPTGARDRTRDREPEYDDDAYVSILFSVFAGGLADPALAECLAVAKDDASFAAFVGERFPRLDRDLIGRIVRVVRCTFQFEYAFHELARRRVTAPVTIFKARGDDYSFVEKASGYSSAAPTVVDLEADHYGLIRESGIEELADAVRRRLRTETEERPMPHVNIKHFPVPLTGEQRTVLVTAITDAVRNAFDCDEDVISIALEPVAKELWNERVYVPEVVDRKELLCKSPNY
jgi:thioesterase domain-containing protein/phenylpyruvate tautomerase PptA (4-oxalocrotonate tautomerase family)